MSAQYTKRGRPSRIKSKVPASPDVDLRSLFNSYAKGIEHVRQKIGPKVPVARGLGKDEEGNFCMTFTILASGAPAVSTLPKSMTNNEGQNPLGVNYVSYDEYVRKNREIVLKSAVFKPEAITP
jgi:hypothetical protein